jgi:predicted DNA-binding protein
MVTKSKGNQVQMAGYYDPAAVEKLRVLSETTRVPKAAYLREALDDVLMKYARVVRKTKHQ